MPRPPAAFLAVAAAATAVQLHPGWRDLLLYDRAEILRGQWWRIWSGHLVHFGWPHFAADAGLFVILGFLLEPRQPGVGRFALAAMPTVISLSLLWLDPGMARYGGLSAVNLGLLVFLACRGWQRNWFDWFWPAVLAVYVGEIAFESLRGGRGGGMIAFDDPSVRVATAAHIPGAVLGVLLWAALAWHARRAPGANAAP